MTENLPLVFVTWLDSSGIAGGHWKDREHVERLTMETIQSIGFLIAETEISITLVAHLGKDQVAGDMCIPKVSIISRKTIRKGGKSNAINPTPTKV